MAALAVALPAGYLIGRKRPGGRWVRPQGGLYGRNSTGGAVSIVTRKPSFDEVEANIAADAGNYGMANVRAGLSVPFTDTFAARIAAQYDSSDGYYYNTYLNRDQGGRDKLQTRLTLSFAPPFSAHVQG